MQGDDRDERVGRHPADCEVRRLLREGDPDAIGILWQHHAERLHAFLLAMLRSRHDAEDVLPDVFVHIARKRSRVARARASATSPGGIRWRR